MNMKSMVIEGVHHNVMKPMLHPEKRVLVDAFVYILTSGYPN